MWWRVFFALILALDEFPVDIYNKIIACVYPFSSDSNCSSRCIFSVNQNAAFFAMRAAIPFMKKNNWGRIINIASVHGKVASANKAPYVAAKHAVVGMTKVPAFTAFAWCICVFFSFFLPLVGSST